MERLLRFGAENFISQGNSQPTDGPVPDTAEQVYISSLALLKMLKHGRAGVPMEVMGLMLGEFVDDYTVTVVDVFAMPQSGTGVSVEAVDPVFQAKMIDMLKQTGRPEMVVGWYHSHPGFGCWLSGVDMNTQQSFEALSDRAVAVVVDPIQSVKGKVVIDAFRLINPNMVIANQEPRQTTSNLGHLNKPSIQALIHGLNRHYYSLPINYRKNKREQTMLMNLDKRTWQEGLTLEDYPTHCNANHKTLQHVLDLVKTYNKSLEEEEKMTPEQLAIKNVGKMDPKRHLEENVDELVWNNITQGLAMGPEKPISSEEARARAERNRQEALLRLQRNQSLKNRSVPSQLLNTIRPNLTTQPNLMNVSQVKASLPRTMSAPTSGSLSKVVRAPIVPKSNEASAYLKRPAPSGSSDYPKGAKVLSFCAKTPSVRAVCVLISRTEFEVQARYHAGLIAVCKSLPTRVYDENTKKWHFNLSDYREFLKRSSGLEGIQLEGLSSAVVTAFKSQMEGNESSAEREVDVNLNDKIPCSLNDSLLGFQREGVKFALKHDGRVLLADDMGLGKTLQSLAIAAAYRSEWPLLIVTQLSLRCTWREAVLTWLGPCLNLTSSDIYIVESLNDALNSIQHIWSRKPITIFTYDLLSRYVEKSGPSTLMNFKVVIMDESHNLKNMKASRTQAALPVLKAAKRAILLTGTPALSRPMELYSQLVGLRPNLFRGGLHEFGLRYCDAKETAWGWDYKGCSNLQELQLLLQETVMIRRLKSEVANQLPPKSRHVKLLNANPVKKSSGPKNSQSVNLASLDLNGVEKHGEVLRLFKETCQSKIAVVKQYITDLLENGRKFIIYAHHQEMLDALSQLMDSKKVGYIRIDGKTSSDQRGASCDLFQTSSTCRVALLSITAASTGLNLTASNLVVFSELYWNPGVLMQAEDRVHRIGQRDSVEIHYLLASGTVDEQLWSLVKNKLDVLSQVGLNKESFDNISLTHVKPKDVQHIDQFFTATTKPSQADTKKEPEKEKRPETKPEVSDETSEDGCKKTTARISLLPPVSTSLTNRQPESAEIRSSEILVPESPPPSTEATDTLDDGADDLLLFALETAVLDESVL